MIAIAGWWFGAIDNTNAAALLANAGAVAGVGVILLRGNAGAGITIVLAFAEKETKLLIETFAHWSAPSLIGLVSSGAGERGIHARGGHARGDVAGRMGKPGRSDEAADAVN